MNTEPRTGCHYPNLWRKNLKNLTLYTKDLRKQQGNIKKSGKQKKYSNQKVVKQNNNNYDDKCNCVLDQYYKIKIFAERFFLSKERFNR